MYESFHHVLISDEMIDYIVSMSEKYIYDRFEPDKSIDILDEVSSIGNVRTLLDNNSALSVLYSILKSKDSDLLITSL